MKILMAYRYGIVGGVCTQMYNRLQHLRSVDGVSVDFFFVRDFGAEAMLAPFGRVHVGSPDDLASIVDRYDVVEVFDTPELYEVVAERAPDRLVVETHSTYPTSLAYLKKLPTPPKMHVVPSAYSKRLLVDLGIAEHTIRLVPNCLDADLFRPCDVARPSRPIVSWVGKLDPHKNWEAFVELAAFLAPRAPELDFWMVGGEANGAPLKAQLVEAIDRLELSGRLRWFSAIPYKSMPRLHSMVAASGGVNVVTSKDESFGMSVAEALLCGCPVVAPSVGALPELYEGDGYTLYPSGDAAALERAIVDRKHSDAAALTAVRDELATRWSPEAAGTTLLGLFS